MLIVRAIRKRLAAEESGFTLIELLVTASIGIVVLIGLMNLIDATGRANARLTDKAETAQRVRVGVDRMARVLRTQACLDNGTPPLSEGTADSVTFYSDTPTKDQVDNGRDSVDGGGNAIVFQPKRVKLSYEQNTGGGTIFQETWTPASGKSPGDYTGAAYVKRPLVDNVGVQNSETPIFKYFNFASLTSPVTAPLDNNLATDPSPANSVKRIVQIDIALRGRPVSGNEETTRTTDASTTVITRNADLSGASDPNRQWGPRCG